MKRILVVGHGLIGKQRARALDAMGALAGTVDPISRDAALYGGAPHYASFDAAPTDIFDAAVIAVPHDLATKIATALAAASKPFLLEKPLGIDVNEARTIDGAVRASGVQSFVGYNYRYLPPIAGL